MATAGTTGLNPWPLPHHLQQGLVYHPCAPPGGWQWHYTFPDFVFPGTGPNEQPPVHASPPRSVQRPATAPTKERVFITYSDDNRDHMKEVLKMAYLLSDQGYVVDVDKFQRHFAAMDKIGWLEDKVENSDFIIVVCSKKYRRDVDGSGPGEDDDHGLNTRYINRAMQTVYLENKCINYKVIPVLFDGYPRDTCPRWLRNTVLYRWPRDVQDVMCRLRREERYKMPASGRPPIITVRRDYS
ncbi:E3 ubiquitin ligase TRAF3IP2-like [Branchiostoma lanceolatum]|uniref:E3 ubiquitin ligase TRAF3IP2-like n=1 Tax=Branchiostoma lanceolatum TaxID=7740 RepID=UPI0034565DB1